MENIYFNNNTNKAAVKANTETINFLMQFSNSLQVVEAKGMQFENNLN